MNGFEKYQQAIVNAALKNPKFNNYLDNSELKSILNNAFYNLDGPKKLNRTLTPQEKYIGIIFHGFGEISNSLQTLADSAIYLGRLSFRDKKIRPERYIQYHVEMHLHEIYILEQRLCSYLKVIQRQFKNNSSLPEINRVMEALNNIIFKSFDGIRKTRGAHVHDRRFNDDDLDRLKLIALFRLSPKKEKNTKLEKAINAYYQHECQVIKKKWKDTANKNYEDIHKLLDIYFDTLIPIVFDSKSGDISLPSRTRPA